MEEKQEDSIIKVFEACARRYGCKVFILDNLMSALTSADEENKAQAKFTARLKAFASKYKVHVIMVAHPRKTKADATFTNDDIAGSSVITNLADNVINVERPNLRITKNRYFGRQDYIICCFDPCNRRIFQANTGDTTVYGWDHSGIALPDNPANTLSEFAIQTANKQPF
jgi:twinkle protein